MPDVDPLGTVSITAPSGVGTLTLAPSTASLSVTGSDRRMLSPSRTKNGCGAISIVTIASPAPAGPFLALAGKADPRAVLDAPWAA